MRMQDEDAAELDESKIVEGVALIAHHEAAKIAQPSEEPFNLPATAIATQRATILRLGFLPVPTVRSDHLHAQLG
jgi:hypothetical protein